MQDFKYFAFISYSHKDMKWARWIHKALESYKLPTVVKKEAGGTLPNRIRPVFRDETDLGVGQLRDNLTQELRSSKHLIVLCSPNSAQPNREGKHYINDEVSLFCTDEAGNFLPDRANRIIPVIIEGTPDEAFCPRLKELEVLALDATKQKKARILNDIVAKILGLRPDALWQREARRLRKRRLIRNLLGGIAATIMAAAGLYCYDVLPEKTFYYADYVDRWGIPEGIFELTEEQTKPRRRHYRFVYQGRQGLFGPRVLRRVSHCNSAGKLEEHTHTERLSRPMDQHIYYRPDGTLERIDFHDRHGNVRIGHSYSGDQNQSVDFVQPREGGVSYNAFDEASTATISKNASLIAERKKKSRIQRYRLTRNEAGFIVRREYHIGGTDTKVSDAEGLYGMAYEVDNLGRVVRITYLGVNNQPVALKNGVAGRAYRYDEAGNLAEMTYLNLEGKPHYNEQGWMRCVATFDAHGNTTHEDFLDDKGDPLLTADLIAGFDLTYDERGFPVTQTNLGLDGKPTLSTNGSAGVRLTYDARGNILLMEYLGTNGEPCLLKDGTSGIKRVYDAQDNMIEEWTLGLDGNPCRTSNGFTCARFTYDERGNVIRFKIFDINNLPATFTDVGNSGWVAEYDVNGYQTKHFLLAKDGGYFTNAEGIAGWESEYDEHGNKIRVTYFDAEGKPCIHKTDGSAGWTSEYNSQGNETKSVFIDLHGNPYVLKNSGFAGWESEYDEHGNKIRLTYFDATWKPTACSEGYVTITSEFDDNGNEIRRLSLNENGQLCTLPEYGIAGWTSEYDARGNLTKRIYLDCEGQPCLHQIESFVGVTQKYDARGNCIEQIYLGVDLKPCLIPAGYAILRQQFNAMGNAIEQTYWGLNNEPVNRKGAGHREIATYDARGNPTSVRLFDAEGRPMLSAQGCAYWTATYDEYGNKTEVKFFGTNGELVEIDKGYAYWRSSYQGYQKEVQCTYYDVNGNACINTALGYASRHKTYDMHGNPLDVAYYLDEAGMIPASDEEGCHRRRIIYQDGVRAALELYYVKGKCTRCPNAQLERERYDAEGNLIEEAFYADEDGTQPVCTTDGFYRVKQVFEKGKVISQFQYFTPDTCQDSADARLKMRRYNAEGDIIEWAYYADEEGTQPVANDGGCYRITADYKNGIRIARNCYYVTGRCKECPDALLEKQRYTEKNELIECAYYADEAGTIPAASEEGWYRKTIDYTDGVKTQVCYYYIPGTCETCPEARFKRERYDTEGNRIEEALYADDAGQEPAANKNGCHRTESIFKDGYCVIQKQYFVVGKSFFGPKVRLRKVIFNRNGDIIRIALYGDDLELEPVEGEKGAASLEIRYDAKGNITERIRRDASGNILTAD